MLYLLSFNILTSATLIFFAKSPIYSILYLIFCFLNATFLLMAYGLDFLALLFIIIYIGAVAVLFVFIIMMLNLRVVDLRESFFTYFPIAFLFLFLFFYEFFNNFTFILSDFFIVSKTSFASRYYFSPDFLHSFLSSSFLHQDVQYLSYALYIHFYFALWLAGILLLSSMIGIIIIALHKNIYVKRQDFYSQILKEEHFALSLEKKIYKKIINWNYFFNQK